MNLVPLEKVHFNDLFDAASDKRIWEYYTGDWSVRETFDEVYNGVLSQRENGSVYPFVIQLKSSGKISAPHGSWTLFRSTGDWKLAEPG